MCTCAMCVRAHVCYAEQVSSSGPLNNKIEIKIENCQTPFALGVDFGAQNAPQNDPKASPKRVKNQDEKCITFLSLFDPSWTGLEAILGPSWGQNEAKNFEKRRSA